MSRATSLTIALALVFTVLAAAGCATKEDLTEKGKLAAMAQRYDAAIMYYNEALEKDPNWVPAIFGLGLAYQGKKEPEKMIETLEGLIKLDPKHELAEEARFNLTKWFFELGREAQQAADNQKAIDHFEKAATYNCKKQQAAEQARTAAFQIRYKEWRPDFIKNDLDERLKTIKEWAEAYAKDKERGAGRPPFIDLGNNLFFIEGVGHEPKDKEKMSQDDARVYTRQSAVDSYVERACFLTYLVAGLEVPEKCSLDAQPKLKEENEFWDNNQVDYVIQAGTSIEDLMKAAFRLILKQEQAQ